MNVLQQELDSFIMHIQHTFTFSSMAPVANTDG